MTIFSAKRGGGKTHRLIMWSVGTGGYIIVSSEERKREIMYDAKRMGLEDKVNVVSRQDMLTHKEPPKGVDISIDDLDDYLNHLFAGYNLKECTTSAKIRR